MNTLEPNYLSGKMVKYTIAHIEGLAKGTIKFLWQTKFKL